ncbi:MAG: hypothetical protein HUU38_26835 [Anaerolineales bacterium]|nr:hypothetical protein [Anaerolineales bacterium]
MPIEIQGTSIRPPDDDYYADWCPNCRRSFRRPIIKVVKRMGKSPNKKNNRLTEESILECPFCGARLYTDEKEG